MAGSFLNYDWHAQVTLIVLILATTDRFVGYPDFSHSYTTNTSKAQPQCVLRKGNLPILR